METSLTWLQRLTTSPDDTDWQRLVNLYAPLVAYWCQKAGVENSDRDDVVQDVLIVVVRRVHEFQHQHDGAFRGWLRMILVNHLRNYFRRNAHRACAFNLDEVCDPHSGLSRIFDREHDEYLAKRAMQIARADFNETTWAAFERQVIQGQPALQVATELQLSINAALKAKSRVLKRIRAELQSCIIS